MKPAIHPNAALHALWAAVLFFVAAMALMFAANAFAAEVAVPKLTARVTDQTGTLDAETQASLNQALADLESRKGAQIAVLVVPSTGDDTIESFARRVFDQWRLGRKKVDDGILFLVAKDDRRLRIEVGYGLEGAVPDLLAGRIIREHVTPRFKEGDYAAGIIAGVESLIKLVDGEALPPPPAGAQAATEDDDSPAIMLLPLAIMSLFMPALFAAVAVGLFVGLMFGSIGWAIFGGVVAFVLSSIGRLMGVQSAGKLARASRRGGALGGGIGGLGGGFGGGFGGGGGGGFGGGGGMSGGGGGSGGGGASGGW
ncbi:MAG TPA: YgcG family protein [Candidimonas sp.]|nr:YgcG family protein [Candidimonas sp.]